MQPNTQPNAQPNSPRHGTDEPAVDGTRLTSDHPTGTTPGGQVTAPPRRSPRDDPATTPTPLSPGRPNPNLFDTDEVDEFRSRWQRLQASFVDDPERAVRDADELVADVMQAMAATFAKHKATLEDQWQPDGQARTEDLRLVLQDYRTFFQRLLTVTR